MLWPEKKCDHPGFCPQGRLWVALLLWNGCFQYNRCVASNNRCTPRTGHMTLPAHAAWTHKDSDPRSFSPTSKTQTCSKMSTLGRAEAAKVMHTPENKEDVGRSLEKTVVNVKSETKIKVMRTWQQDHMAYAQLIPLYDCTSIKPLCATCCCWNRMVVQ